MTYTDPLTRHLATRLASPVDIDQMTDSEFDDWFNVAWIMTMMEEPELLLEKGERPPVIPSAIARRAEIISAVECRAFLAPTVH